MTRACLCAAKLNRKDAYTVLVLLLAFVISGWKVWTRPSVAGYAVVAKQAATAAPAALALKSEQRAKADTSLKFDTQFVSALPGQAVHAASMVELRNGDLRAVWFSGSREGAGDVTIQTAVMDAASQRWALESTLFNRQQVQKALWRYVKKLGNPVIARAADGSLMVWMVNVSLGGWAGSAISWSRSQDEGVTWSQPRRLVTSPLLNISTLVKGAPVLLADGQISLPVYHEFVRKFGEVLRITTQGQVSDKVRLPQSQRSLQPVLLVTDSLHANAYMRAGQGGKVMASATKDGGQSWSLAHNTDIPNPDSALAGMVASNGRQWLALNPSQTGRSSLGLLASNQAGNFEDLVPWLVEGTLEQQPKLSVVSYERLLVQQLQAAGVGQAQINAYVASARRQLCGSETCAQEFSYPFLLQTRDGYVHLIYTWHRTRIKHVRLDPWQPLLTAAH